MADRFLLHFTQKHPRNWRLRCLSKHPRDPGWEVGTYEKCHDTVRPKHEKGDVIFDVVVKNGRPVIRSVFTIKDTKIVKGETKWFFDEYYFSDDEPYELPGDYIKYRMMFLKTFLDKYSDENPLDYVKANYTLYKKGEKPKSINQEDWDRIQKMRKNISKEIYARKNSDKS